MGQGRRRGGQLRRGEDKETTFVVLQLLYRGIGLGEFFPRRSLYRRGFCRSDAVNIFLRWSWCIGLLFDRDGGGAENLPSSRFS